jgi:catechol 2,3-dioxygenase-like lactoylglutathione lyase family enzyme
MERVNGIGGIFFKATDPAKLTGWYREHLGIDAKGGFFSFAWREAERPERVGRTVWAPFPEDTEYFKPSEASFMINYRVANLAQMLEQLRQAGVPITGQTEDENGRFAWIMDPEGNRIELWEPPAGA